MSSTRRRPDQHRGNRILAEASGQTPPPLAEVDPTPRVRRARLLELDWRTVAPNPLNPRTSLRGKVNVDDIDLGDFDDLPANGKNNDPSSIVTRAAYLAIHPEIETELDANYPGVDYVVVFGSRRRLACEKHDAVFQAVVNDEFAATQVRFHAAAVKENLGRKDLDPLDEAEAIAEQVRLCGGVQAEAARVLGYSAPFIRQRLDLKRLLPELKSVLRAKGMTVEQGRKIGAMPEEEQLVAWTSIQAADQSINAVNPKGSGAGVAPGPEEAASQGEPNRLPGKGRPRTKVSFKLSETPEAIADTLTASLDHDTLTKITQVLIAKNHAVAADPRGLAEQLKVELTSEHLRELVDELSR